MDTTKTATAVEREGRRACWQGHVERQAQSGQTMTAYCAEHGLKTWQLAYWRKTLQTRPGTSSGFVELTAALPALTVECAGCRLVVQRGFDGTLLREVVAALRAS